MPFINLTNQRFGRLRALCISHRKGDRIFWRCICDCGNSVDVSGAHLRNGNTQSCKCLARERLDEGRKKAHAEKLIDITGQRFGRLTALSIDHRRKYGHATLIYWKCQCDCGNTTITALSKLRSGHTQSCGCISKDQHYIHGMSNSPEFVTWASMLQRCYNPKNSRYKDYGGRGITVCDKWRTSFVTFYQDMRRRPSLNHSIERLNNNLGYYPDNCIWATQSIQTRNMRRNVIYTIGDRTQCLQDWVKESKIPLGTIRGRLRRRWSIERALTEPVHEQFRSL